MSRRSVRASGSSYDGFGLNVFSTDSMDYIHDATLEVLWQEGISTECQLAKEIYAAGGCRVDDKKNRVYIPPRVVEEAIDSTPSTVLLAARDPQHDIIMEGTRVNFCNFSKGVNVVDLDTGEFRLSVLEDQVRIAKLVDYLEQYDLCDVGVEARDVPDVIANLASYEAMVNNTTKHSTQSAHSKAEAETFIKMALAVAGSQEELERRPITSTVVCPTSPLTISPETTEPIIVYAQHKVPCTVLSMAMAGGTAPITLAGTMVTHNAEVLSGIVLGQLTNKGTPNMYGSSTTIMDLRNASATVGCPELGMLSAAVCKMAQYYRIPSYVAGG